MQALEESGDVKRLFFGLEIEAAWMQPLPEGRILREECRHMTLAFLGNQSYLRLQTDLADFPICDPYLGFAGHCDRLLFLPPRRPHVVSGHIDWVDQPAVHQCYQRLVSWLREKGYPVDSRELLSHVTLARAPFQIKKWKEAFLPFPLLAKSLHLYESEGNLTYRPLWSLPFILPLEEIEHTADVAFLIRGKNIRQLFRHARLALAFKFPRLLDYASTDTGMESLDEVIIQLNALVSRADAEVGCPFKAISFHGEITKGIGGYLQWEMIIDV